MSDTSNVITALITGGLGAAMGSIGTAAIQSISSKGESRAIAADRVTHAAGNLADRLDRMNVRLEEENVAMRKAMVALTEAIEDLLPIVDDEPTRQRVQHAINTARMAFR